MSETSNRTPASISGPKRRQAWQDGELPESRKRCVVEAIEATSDLAGAVVVAVAALPGSKELIVQAADASILFSDSAQQEDGSVMSCELAIAEDRYGITSIAHDSIDGQPILRLSTTVLTVRGRRLDIQIPGAFSGMILSEVKEEQPLEVWWRRSATTYYGTFICVPGGSVSYQRKRQNLEATWRRENRHPFFVDGQPNPLPQYVREALDLEAEVGTSVVDFEDFVDDSGPIPNRLPDGNLNEAALLSLLQIRAFHAALTTFYQGDAFDLEQHLALEKKVSKSSSGTLSTPAPSSDSLPS